MRVYADSSFLLRLVKRGAFQEVVLDMDTAMDRARRLAAAHTDRLGARAIDLLHVAGTLRDSSDPIALDSSGRKPSVLAKSILQHPWVCHLTNHAD